MTAASQDLRVVEQLAVALASGDLGERAEQVGEDLYRRLTEPVRIAVFGPPGAGKSEVVDLITGAMLLPPDIGLPTAELIYGAEEGITLTFEDGHREMRGGIDFAGLDMESILFVQVQAPLPVLERITLLEVVADDDPEEQAAALAWAAARCDMAIWCSRDFDDIQAAVWGQAPEALRDHAFLVLTDEQECISAPDGAAAFAHVHHLATTESASAASEALRKAVFDHVDLGRREDMDGALLFLDRHGLRPRRNVAAAHAPVAAKAPLASEATRPPGPMPTVTPDTAAAVERLRAAAQAIDASDAPDVILSQCIDTVEEVDIALRGSGRLDGGLEQTLGEAADLLVLLQLEGDAGASEDAVTLLLQVRRAVEQAAA